MFEALKTFNRILISKLKMETCWTILRYFGYGDNLRLNPSLYSCNSISEEELVIFCSYLPHGYNFGVHLSNKENLILLFNTECSAAVFRPSILTHCVLLFVFLAGNIKLPARVQEAMQMQVEAERKKRAKVLESEGMRESDVRGDV